MQQILTAQQLQRLDMEISQTPLRKELLYILDNIEQATQEMLESIPLYSLIYLQYLAQSKNLNKATQILQKEIETNLQAQQRARKAEQELQMNKKLADEAERRAEKAEQLANEAEVWAQGLKNLRKSMELRYKQMNKS